MKKHYWTLFVFAITTLSLGAQQDLTLYDLRSVPQANQINVSRMPYSRAYVSLPVISGVYLSPYNQGFTYSDMFYVDDTNALRIDIPKAIAEMDDLNDMGIDFRTTLLGFGFRTGASYITFNIESKISGRFTYPKTLFEFLWYGNGHPDYIGKRLALDGLGGDYMQYTEFSLGFARDLNEKWSAGVRAKYLSGLANLKTTDTRLGLTTSADDYSIKLDGALSYRSAGAMTAILDSNVEFNEAISQSITGNYGFAIDLGATYHVTEKLSLSLAVNDLGFISWNSNVVNGTSNDVEYYYDGQDLNDWIEGGATGNGTGLTKVLDSILEGVEFEEDNNPYTTTLPIKTYLGANYQLFKKTDANFLTYNEFYNGKWRSSLKVGITQKVRNWFAATVNYSIYGRSYTNVGLGFSANAGPVQLYVVSDNALAYLFPDQVRNFHLRFGLNLTFANNFGQK